MAERIINITCPNCKHGIKHDTLMNTTRGIPPKEYPEVNEHGRAWCKMCQHGTYPTEDGLCSECLDKGRETRLRPEGDSDPKPAPVKEVEVAIEEVEEEPVGVTLEDTPSSSTNSSSTKTSKKVNKTKVLR